MANNQISTERGREKFHHEGYMYVFEKYNQNGTKKYWQCERKLGTFKQIFCYILIAAVNYEIKIAKLDYTHLLRRELY